MDWPIHYISQTGKSFNEGFDKNIETIKTTTESRFIVILI